MMPSSNHKLPPESFDARFVAVIRCVLAVAALLVLTIAPESRLSFPGMAHLVLALYFAYSILLYTVTHRWHSSLPVSIEPWFDVGWAAALTVLSSDPSDIFAGFLFFTILVTAFQWGRAPGFRLARVVAILILSLGMGLGYSDANTGIRYTLMGAAAMEMWGYLAASFSKHALRHKRRLALLKEISRLSNPRFSSDHTLRMVAEQLRAFYDADACLLITPDPCRPEYQLRRAERQSTTHTGRGEVLPIASPHLLLAWPEQDAVIFSGRHWFWRRCFPKASAEVIDLRRGARRPSVERHSEAVATILDAMAFVTVPLSSPDLHGGRLYITAGRRGVFDQDDVEFLLLVIDHTIPVLQNIKLVDQLASDAADAERQRIALDFHDRVIQPYIGLQMVLEVIRQKLGLADADITHDIDCLLDLTRDELAQLRRLVQGLKNGGERVSDLGSAIQRFGRKFMAATGIQVRVDVRGEPHVNDRLAAEIFHIVTEGLSNIRRHTLATTASITLTQENSQLSIEIRNDGAEGETFEPFTPRSITERALALGGQVRVERQNQTHAAVIAKIPLEEQSYAFRRRQCANLPREPFHTEGPACSPVSE
jgi:signal transduction histidine kinase